MRELKFAMIGAGFWSQYQLAAWGEVSGARCIAICDPVLEKAQRLAKTFAVPHVYRDLRELLDQHELDFVDIVTSVETHASLAMTALQRGVAVICQKPLADSLEVARGLCRRSRELAVPLLVHENFRWQQPIRCLKAVIDSGELGELVRARIEIDDAQPGMQQVGIHAADAPADRAMAIRTASPHQTQAFRGAIRGQVPPAVISGDAAHVRPPCPA